MTDTPRKTLTLKRKPPADTVAPPPVTLTPVAEEPAPKETRLLGKRIIRRDELLPQSRPPKPNKPRGEPQKGRQGKPNNKQAPQTDEPAPSEVQAKALDRLLVERFPVWLDYKPLSLGVEADLYQFMDQHQPPASKRVVQRLLRMHCNHGKYLQAVIGGKERYTLIGEIVGEVSSAERDHATRTLESYELKKQQR